MKEHPETTQKSTPPGHGQNSQESAGSIQDNRSQSAELLQMKEMMHNSPRTITQRKAFTSAFGTATPAPPPPNNTGMPDHLKSGLEYLSGMDLSDVKVHFNSSRPAQLQAHAYAQGSDIHLAPGQEKHLPHEGWHVVQQRQGRVKPTFQLKGTAVNDEPGLEAEADDMGKKATRFTPGNVPGNKDLPALKSNVQSTAQRVKNIEKGTKVITSGFTQYIGVVDSFDNADTYIIKAIAFKSGDEKWQKHRSDKQIKEKYVSRCSNERYKEIAGSAIPEAGNQANAAAAAGGGAAGAENRGSEFDAKLADVKGAGGGSSNDHAASGSASAAAAAGAAAGYGGNEADVKSAHVNVTSWKRNILLARVMKDELAGVCNALSGAYLAGLINPKTDDTMGIDDTNYENIRQLKTLMDIIVTNFYEADSSLVTFVFAQYIKSKRDANAWLRSLNDKTLNKEFAKFKSYFKKFTEEDDDDDDKADADKVDYKGTYIDGLNTTIDQESIYTKVDDLLEPFFDMKSDFQGLIVLKASYKDAEANDDSPRQAAGAGAAKDVKSESNKNHEAPVRENYYASHQMGIRYIASTHTFEIFDQNSGLRSQRIVEQEDIAEIIAGHIHPNYVTNPMTGVNPYSQKKKETNFIDIQVSFYFKKQPNGDQSDHDE